MKIFTFRRIPVRLSWAWLIFTVALFSIMFIGDRAKGQAEIWKDLQILAKYMTAYGLVILHEFGHALTAQRLKLECKSVTLYPYSGLALMDKIPIEDGKSEFWVAVNGPLVNLALFLLMLPFAIIFKHWYLVAFAEINASLFAFNLIPTLPMDGGRILRSIMTIRTKDHVTATKWGARIGTIAGLIGAITFAILGMWVATFILSFAALLCNMEYDCVLKEEHKKALGIFRENHKVEIDTIQNVINISLKYWDLNAFQRRMAIEIIGAEMGKRYEAEEAIEDAEEDEGEGEDVLDGVNDEEPVAVAAAAPQDGKDASNN